MTYDREISDSEILAEMLRPEVRVRLYEEYGRDVLRLSEPKAPDSRAKIYGMPHDASDRFVAITNTGAQKQKSVEYKNAPVHDCPEKFMKMSSPHYLQFNKLVGG